MPLPFPAEGSSRKKAGSVNFGRQPWKTEEREDQRVSQNVSRVLSESVLLSAAVYQSGTHVLGILWLTAPLNLVGMFGWRAFIRWQQVRAHARGRGVRRVLIIGAGALGQEAAAALESDDGRKLVGFLDDNEPRGGSILARLSDLSRIARSEFVDEIIVAFPGKSELKQRLIREARRGRLAVSIVPDYLDCESRTLEFDCLGGLPLLTLHEDQRVLALYSKRVVDVVLSSVGLLITAPLIALIALAIKLDSRGPAFYRAPRAGRKGRSFACCKFRTMVVNADGWKERLRKNNEREGPTFKIAGDPRVTRVGRFLRRYSLDELPQLCNVLRGEMSLVGPRPHTLDDFQRYHLDHLRRLDVTPGITGLWQVTARQDPSFQRNMALDVQYIENWDFWMDLQILCRTRSEEHTS